MQGIIDLSHTISADMPVYPGTKPPVFLESSSIKKDGFKESVYTFYSHIGTHLDAPAHIFPDGKTVDLFDSNKFFGPALIIDCTNKNSIDLKFVKQAVSGSFKTEFILFYTGWSEYWGMDQYYHGFPVLTPEAAQYISSFPVKGMGIDAISFDAVGEGYLTNHKILLGKEIILVENLRLLKLLLNKKFLFSCLPLNIAGLDGAPTRAFAIIK